jgi:heme exporter protein D
MPNTKGLLPSSRFYTSRQIYVASFLGSPLAAAWFMACNWTALGDELRALRFLWLGFGATIVAMAVAFILPDQTPHIFWPLLYSIAIYQWAKVLFDRPFAQFISNGGVRGSWWAVVGISVLALVVVLGMISAALYFVP